MTDQEALALEEAQAEVTRLNAVWGLEFTPYFHPETQTYRFYATIEAGVEDDSLGVWVKETSITIRTDFAGYGLIAQWSGLIDEHSTRREEEGVEFINTWLDYFRRGCWLSGCPIEASAHEKMEWMQGFSEEELKL